MIKLTLLFKKEEDTKKKVKIILILYFNMRILFYIFKPKYYNYTIVIFFFHSNGSRRCRQSDTLTTIRRWTLASLSCLHQFSLSFATRSWNLYSAQKA